MKEERAQQMNMLDSTREVGQGNCKFLNVGEGEFIQFTQWHRSQIHLNTAA